MNKEANYGISKESKVGVRHLKLIRNTKTIAEIMKVYTSKFGLKERDLESKFFEAYWERMMNRAIDDGKRVVLPHNLGYMQVLEYAYTGNNVKHIKQYGMVNYGFFWFKHPMFLYHTFTFSKSIRKRIFDKVNKGMNYLKEYVDGDFYVSA